MALRGSSLVRALQQTLLEQDLAPLSDAQLLVRFLDLDDQSAFGLLITRHGGLVQSVCQRILRHSFLVEDAVQATFVILARKGDTIRKRESVSSWLFGVARRVALKAREQYLRQLHHEQLAATLKESPSQESTNWEELLNTLDEELHRLAPCYQAPLLACYYRGLTQDEAARELGWPLITLRRRLEKARAILKDRLTRRDVSFAAVLFANSVSDWNAVKGMSETLRLQTIQTIRQWRSGEAIHPSIDLLVQGTLPMLKSMKWFIAATIVVVSCLGVVGWIWSQLPLQQLPELVQKTPSNKTKDANPSIGEPPLPDGAVARLGSMKFNPGEMLHGCFYTPDGKQIISMGDRFVRIWDRETGYEVRHFPVPPLNLSYQDDVILSEDGKTLYSLKSRRNEIATWDIETGKMVTKELAHPEKDSVDTLHAFSRDGKWTLLSSKQALHVYDVQTGKEKWKLPTNGKHTAVTFSNDSKYLVSGDSENGIAVWDLETGGRLREWGTGKPVLYLTASPKEKWLATMERSNNYWLQTRTNSKEQTNFPEKDTIQLWDLTTGKELHKLETKPQYLVSFFVFSGDGKRVAAIVRNTPRKNTKDHTELVVWDVASGAIIREVKDAYGNPITFSPDGKELLLSSGDEAISRWDLETGKSIPSDTAISHFSKFLFLTDKPNSLFISDREMISEWDYLKGKKIRSFKTLGGSNRPPIMSFSPDGKYALGTSGWGDDGKFDLDGPNATSGTLYVWDIETNKELHRASTFVYDRELFSPNSKRLVKLHQKDWKSSTIEIWDLQHGKLIHSIKDLKLESLYSDLSFTPDGKTLMVMGKLTMIGLDVETGKKRFSWQVDVIPELTSLQGKQELHDENTDPEQVSIGRAFQTSAFSPDGKQIAYLIPWNPDNDPLKEMNRLQISDVQTGKVLHRFEPFSDPLFVHHHALAYSPNGRYLASSNGYDVYLWDTTTGKKTNTFRGHRGDVSQIVFIHDGKYLASASRDGTVLIWEVK
jgi:RNA polymerase sigma factor (sigma-70 family)